MLDGLVWYGMVFKVCCICFRIASVRDNPYWTSTNSLELIELSNINEVTLFQVSVCIPSHIR